MRARASLHPSIEMLADQQFGKLREHLPVETSRPGRADPFSHRGNRRTAFLAEFPRRSLRDNRGPFSATELIGRPCGQPERRSRSARRSLDRRESALQQVLPEGPKERIGSCSLQDGSLPRPDSYRVWMSEALLPKIYFLYRPDVRCHFGGTSPKEAKPLPKMTQAGRDEATCLII